jgi:hypothetical protein
MAADPDYQAWCERAAAAGCLIGGADLREVPGGVHRRRRLHRQGRMRRRLRDTRSGRAGRRMPRYGAPPMQARQPRRAGSPMAAPARTAGSRPSGTASGAASSCGDSNARCHRAPPRHCQPAGRAPGAPGRWSAACCSAGTSSSTRRPRSSPPPPSRRRSKPVRRPGHRAGASVFPPIASRCSDHGIGYRARLELVTRSLTALSTAAVAGDPDVRSARDRGRDRIPVQAVHVGAGAARVLHAAARRDRGAREAAGSDEHLLALVVPPCRCAFDIVSTARR